MKCACPDETNLVIWSSEDVGLRLSWSKGVSLGAATVIDLIHKSLVHQRALHCVVMALNFMHHGFKHVPVHLLGRQPSTLHGAIYRRLRLLLVACDRPGLHPVPPGRSGFEFIARLVELEHFASSKGAFSSDPYSAESEDPSAQFESLGVIQPEHKFRVSEAFSPFQPYRSLIAERLKLSGCGQWHMADHLHDILWLPFLEPRILLHGQPVSWDGPNFAKEVYAQNLELVKIWDNRGLLALFTEPHETNLGCRVFNAHKNDQVDRQIGDRRWVNGCEMHPTGPSRFLPGGPTMTSLRCPTSMKLVGCASDRKDFYHQAYVSRERAHSNVIGIEFKKTDLLATQAYADLLATLNVSSSRETSGDRYGMKPKPILSEKDITSLYCGFKSLYQGDHLGVEYALSSHAALLHDGGLLGSSSNILRHNPFPRDGLWEGLVIDDYFVISREAAGDDSNEAKSVKCLERAEGIYETHGVIGSPDKTVRAAEAFKVIGAEVQSDQQARGCNVITVSAPSSKRIPLCGLSLKIAAMPFITRSLAARLAGNWVSVLMFRRPLCCILDKIFALGTKSESNGDEVLKLTRPVAEELTLASVLSFVALTDISVKYDPKVYATDASNHKGAITSCDVGCELSSLLWCGGDRKGAYTMLDNPARRQLRALGIDTDERPVAEDFHEPPKTLDFCFDFVEILGGSGTLSKEAAKRGLRVCAPIDLSASPHFNIENTRLLEWIFQMLFEKRFLSIMCEPVCTTFSPAQHPASRSYDRPLGFCRTDRKTFIGNLIAFRCLAIIWFAGIRCKAPALLEQPLLSKMAWLPFWKFLLSLGFREGFLDSCAFGSIHKKPFRFIGKGLAIEKINVKCPGGHKHVRIEGKYTRPSAVYHPALAAFLAERFVEALSRDDAASLKANKPEIESVVCNDLLQAGHWKIERSWEWNKPAHINVLESRSLTGLCRDLVLEGGDRRAFVLADSRVAKGAHAKGRSTALALKPSLVQACTYGIVGNIHFSYGFAPTRINTADAPTRNRDLSSPANLSILDFLSTSQIAALHSRQFSRAAAGWVRLYILVAFCLCPGEGCWTCNHPSDFTHFGFWTLLAPRSENSDHVFAGLCFLLGLIFAVISGIFHHCNHSKPSVSSSPSRGLGSLFSFKVARYSVLLAVFLSSNAAMAMPLTPVGREEAARAARRSGNVLQADRVVLQSTRDRRCTLLLAFDNWLSENWRTNLEGLLEPSGLDCEAVTEALVAYGKDLYDSGKSYGKYSETINAVTQRRPMLRRRIAAAWDLAFNWVVDEPHEHHTAMPLSLMIATVSLSLLWGWTREAALIAMTWCGVLRVGEALSARRCDLVLPCDAAPGIDTVLLKIRLPKTRGRAARHQSAKIEPADVVLLLTFVFKGLCSSEMLWPSSPSSLRKRFSILQGALGLAKDSKGFWPYSLSSLRPGGATYWLQATEDAEFVRRKGRWLSTRVLEIYLQEAAFATFQSRMPLEAQSRVAALCEQFPTILKRAHFFKESKFPESLWPRLWWCWVCGKSAILHLGWIASHVQRRPKWIGKELGLSSWVP